MPNSNRGGSHDQHVKAGQQSHKNDGDNTRQGNKTSQTGGERGGSHEQHVKAGEQSHKND